ncbi:hypothetical protein [Sphingopyxis microcysteis]|uniref:hypothetical protein n=1 Tax=Sphingopyxis microcysteis TaxID=2484145 RepID=UPI001447BA72|nr:hypothetical protein [Sphingopyxis microcysteis]
MTNIDRLRSFAIKLVLGSTLVLASCGDPMASSPEQRPHASPAQMERNHEPPSLFRDEMKTEMEMHEIDELRRKNGKDNDAWIVAENSPDSRKMLALLENGISNGDKIFQKILIDSYIDASKDNKIPTRNRRNYLIKAIWTWQRISPSVENWKDTGSKIEIKSSDSAYNRKILQELIIELEKLDE